MVNNNTIALSSPDSEFRLPLNVSLVSPKSEMLLPASKPRVAVSMVLSEDKTEIIEIEEILYDDSDEDTEISIIKQEKDCTITNVTCKPPSDHPKLTITNVTCIPPNDRPTLKSEVGITQELVVKIARTDLEKLSEDTKSRKRKRSDKRRNAAPSKPRPIKSEASNDVESDIDADNAENSDWIIKSEEVDLKFEGGEEDDHQESSSTSSSQRDSEDDKYQMQQSQEGLARPSKNVRKPCQRVHHCPHCGYEAPYACYLKKHISIVHEKGEGLEKYSCSKCTFQTFYKVHLALHIRRHDGVKVKHQRCSRCGYSTSRKNGLTDHVCDKELEVLTCYDCGYQTVLKTNLRSHVSCHSHTENFSFNCNVCSFGTKYKHTLKSHMVRHNRNLDGFKRYKCTKCDYQSHAKGNLKKHGLVHKAGKDVPSYGCYHCDYRTNKKYTLKMHVRLHNKRHYEAAKTLKCSECDFKTVSNSSLKRHLMRHKDREEIPMKKCDRCDYSTFRKCHLDRHKRTHNLK